MTETLKVAIDARGGQTGAQVFEQSGKKVTDVARGIDGRLRRLDGTFVRTGKTARSVGGILRNVFVGLTAGVVIRDAIRTISSFEETIATLGGVANATGDQLTELSDTAKLLGATTRFTATEAGEGLLFLARAGFDVEEAIEAVPSTLSLASAGLLELGEAADIASNVLSQFGLEAEETERVADVLVRTANTANTNVSQLAEALKLAGPVAGALGIEVEDTARAIGLLGDAGIQGSLAGTNLRGVLLGLAAPTTEAKKALEELGLSVEDVSPATNDLGVILRRLSDAGLAAAENVDLAESIFGRRNIAAAQVLTNAVDQYDMRLNLTGRTAEELARIQDDTLAGSFRSLRSAVEANFIAFGESGFAGVLKNVVDRITDALRVLAGFDDELKGSKESAERLANIIKGLAGAAGFIGLVKGIQLTIGALQALKIALISSGIGAIPVIIGTAVAAFITFKDEIEDIRVAGLRLGDIFTATIENIRERWEFIWPRLKVVVEETVEEIVTRIKDGFNLILTVTSDILESLGTNWEEVFDFLGDVGKRFANFQIGLLKSVGDSIRIVFEALLSNFRELGRIDFSNPIAFVSSLGSVSLANIERSFDAIGDLGSTVGENFSEDYVGALQDAGADALEALVGGFRGFEGEEAFQEFFGNFFSDIAADAAELEGRRSAERFAMSLIERAGELKDDVLNALGFRPSDEDDEQGPSAGALGTPDDLGLNEDLLEQQERFLEAIEREADFLELEAQLVGATNAEREISIALYEAETLGIDANIEALERLRQKLEELQEAQELQNIADQIGDSFAQNLEDVVFNVKEADEALKDFTESFIKLLFQQNVTNQISGGIGSFFGPQGGGGGFLSFLFPNAGNALGNVFSGQGVVPFQDGAVFNQPFTFPLATGMVGLGAEAGPEALVPLGRDSQGRLGIRQADGGGQQTTFNFTQNISGVADLGSFRRSQRQQEQSAQRLIGNVPR